MVMCSLYLCKQHIMLDRFYSELRQSMATEDRSTIQTGSFFCYFPHYSMLSLYKASLKISMCMEQKTEALESATKRFEELEFCQLEEESRTEERKETESSRLLQEQAEFHRRLALRKVRNGLVAHGIFETLGYANAFSSSAMVEHEV